MTISIWPHVGPNNIADDIVLDGWLSAQRMSSAAFQNALTYLDNIANIGSSVAQIPQLDVTMRELVSTVSPFIKPTKQAELVVDANFPTYDADVSLTNVELMQIPSEPALTAIKPAAEFVYQEVSYSSTLLSQVQTQLEALLSGMQTGIPAEVEQQIWERSRHRIAVAARRLKAQNSRVWSGAGWDMPGGDLTNKDYEAEQEAVNQEAEESSRIAIAQADLEQKNRQFAITTAFQVEAMLVQHFDQVQLRALDAAKYVVEAATKLYGLDLEEYKIKLDGFKSIIDARRSVMDAEIKINQEIPLMVFKEKSEAIRTLIMGESERLKALTEVNKNRADTFKTETDAEASRVEGEVKVQEQEVKYLTAEAGVKIDSGKANISALLAEIQILVEAAKAGSASASQMLASIMSTVNLSAGISESNNTSSSSSFSESFSTSYNHNIQE